MERLGDMEELFHSESEKYGRIQASFRYIWRCARILANSACLALVWKGAMLRNYILAAWRQLLRQKALALINIVGLAIGISVFSVIALWIRHELSFDRFHANASNIYRLAEHRRFPDLVQTSYRTPGPLVPALRQNFPEITAAVRVAWTGERVIRCREKIHYERDILTVDPEFFTLFSFPLVEGRPGTVLENPFAMVITESTARKYFGTDEALGQTLSMDNRWEFTVTGVVRDAPPNSHLQFDMLVPFDIVKRLGWAADSWDFSMALTYIALDPQVDRISLEPRISDLIKSQYPESNIEIFTQPLTRIRLQTNFDNPDSPGRIQYIRIFALVGMLILSMACINYMNLATARSETRSREIGMRKVVGANRSHIAQQFLTESTLSALAALTVSPILIQLFLTQINKITETTFTLLDFTHLELPALLLGTSLLTGILSGSYPAVFLSRFKPAATLKSQPTSSLRGSRFRETLVVFQMMISLVLIIVSLVIFTQVGFLKNKALGFNQNFVLSIPLGISNSENPHLFEVFKQELRSNPRVEAVSGAFTHPTMFGTQAKDVMYKGRKLDDETPIYITSVTDDFVETLQVEIIKGRSFSREYGGEGGNLLINQQMENLLDEESALDKTILIGGDYEGRIIGVMKDFHIEAVSSGQIGPLLLFLNPNVNYIFVRIVPSQMEQTLESLEASWKNAAPHLPFTFTFLDQDIERLYLDVQNLGSVLKYMTILAVSLAVLGLLGLAAFAAQKRTKEIGIRKICGASSPEIVLLLGRDFVRLALIANLFACPVAGWIMYRWLHAFPYRISLNAWIFLGAGAALLLVTLLTVCFQTLKAALVRPVKSLRYE